MNECEHLKEELETLSVLVRFLKELNIDTVEDCVQVPLAQIPGRDMR